MDAQEGPLEAFWGPKKAESRHLEQKVALRLTLGTQPLSKVLRDHRWHAPRKQEGATMERQGGQSGNFFKEKTNDFHIQF